jgi:hypothetical protein
VFHVKINCGALVLNKNAANSYYDKAVQLFHVECKVGLVKCRT